MTDLKNQRPALTAYTERDVLATVQRILDTIGLRAPYDPLALPVDQYHSGGHEAVTTTGGRCHGHHQRPARPRHRIRPRRTQPA